jgi:hypothetical protein
MDKKVNCNTEFRCNICNKNYASNSSLCNHNKKFHKNNVVQKGSSVVLHEVVCGTSLINNKSQCKYCNKLFNDRSNKYKHEKICKNKTTDNSKISELEDTINKLKDTYLINEYLSNEDFELFLIVFIIIIIVLKILL